jgi:hypothetical protein
VGCGGENQPLWTDERRALRKYGIKGEEYKKEDKC